MGSGFVELLEITRKLRAPGGCPWDAAQTLESVRRHILEEAHELVEAIGDGGSRDAREICEECGDLLLQVVFVAEIASGSGMFDIRDVCRAICDKLVRRHPHDFGDVTVRDSEEVSRNWEAIKAGERKKRDEDSSAMAGIPRGLPALLRALRVSEKAAKKGFDWKEGDAASVRAKVLEELDELAAEVARGDAESSVNELGDVLFSLANVARRLGIDPEGALQGANEKFIRRFRGMEALAAGRELDMAGMSLEEWDTLWDGVKAMES
jgi:MazG family protein